MWLPWSSSKDSNTSTEIQQPSTGEFKSQRAEEDVRHLGVAWGELSQLSFGTYPLLGLGASVIFLGGWTAHRRWDSLYSRHFKRITRHYDVPDAYIREKRYTKGVITGYVRSSPIPSSRPGRRRTEYRVPDGDGFLFFHTPGPGWRWPLKFRRPPKLKRCESACTPRAPWLRYDLLYIVAGAGEVIRMRMAAIDAPEVGS